MRRALVLLMFAACGDGAPAPDAMPPADATAGVVRVRYGGPNPANQRVLFQDADSTMVLATRTDATGRANAYMTPGGFATIVATEPGLGGPRLYTWSGVQPGDDLVVDDGGFVAAAPTHIVTLSVPPVDTGLSYRMYTRCVTTSGGGPIDVTSATINPTIYYLFDCDDTADLLVIPNASTLQYLFTHAADIRGVTPLELFGAYHPWETSSVFVDHIPETWDEVSINRTLLDRGVAYYNDSHTADIGPERQIAQNIAFASPPDSVMRIDIGPLTPGGSLGVLHAAHWGPPQQIARFDLGATALRPFTSRPSYDAAASAIRWTEGAGERPDAALVEWKWSKPGGVGNLDWLIVAPRTDEPAVRLPVLPADLQPRLDETMPSVSGLATFAIRGGYDATRSHMLDGNAFNQFPAVGDSGDVVTQQLDPSLPN